MFSYFLGFESGKYGCRIVQQETRTNCSMFCYSGRVVGKGQKRASR